MRRALVTGAAGFLGQQLTDALSKSGWLVIGIGRQTRPDAPWVTVCDLNDSARLTTLIANFAPEVIFHAAALTPAAAPRAAASDFYQVNLIGSLNVLEAARQHVPNVRVILVTSSAMYGRVASADGMVYEDSPLNPVNLYGVSKAAQHLLGYQYAAQYGMDVVRICPFNLIGPGLPLGLVAADFAHQIVAIERGQQEAVITVGNLDAQRDFLDVRDAAQGLLAAAERGVTGESYNLSSGMAITIRTVLDVLVDHSKVSIEVKQRPDAPANPVPIQIGVNTKLSTATGWNMTNPTTQSLTDVLTFWRGKQG
jgi:GDP-4-dehydro-6-deoxy-D-mannose reductase